MMLHGDDGRTVLYLIRHGATEANLSQPPRIQGRAHNPPLAPLGVRQAEATRDFLAGRTIQHCYTSPLLRAVQTATVIAAPRGVSPIPREELTECDVGLWEGLDWQTIRDRDADSYQRFHANPAAFGYPGGESFQTVYDRVQPALEGILERHRGQAVLVVAHHVVNRTYLAGLLGLAPGQARRVTLDNCGVSVVVREGDKTALHMLNAAFHLDRAAA